ncbi:MAG: VCBS repeat-containing protein [Acidobacteria bacterium]|nr:VCBS repeat-containing protein [Acidobacteriota bacterium]
MPAVLAAGPSGSVLVAGRTRGRAPGESLFVGRVEAGGNRRQFTARIGGSSGDVLTAIAVDRTGNVVVAGYTNSAKFPVFGGGGDVALSGRTDLFVAALDAKGNWLWSTLVGGSGDDRAQAIALDANGDVYVTGWTSSPDFPAQGEATGPVRAFVVKLRAGSRVSGWLIDAGEKTRGNAIAADRTGAIYVGGSVDGRALLVKLSGDGDELFAAIAADGAEQAITALALAQDGSVWAVGPATKTRHTNLAHFDREGTRTFSKQLDVDEAQSVALDPAGNVYVTGIRRDDAAAPRSFAMKLSPDGDRTYFAEDLAVTPVEGLLPMAVDALGNIHVAGSAKGDIGIHRVQTCGYKLSKSLETFDASGGAGSVLVQAQEECAWNPESTAHWIGVARQQDRFELMVMPNDSGGPRAGTVVAGGQALIVTQAGKANGTQSAITGAIRGNAGFQTSRISACDDCSAAVALLGFSINFFGTNYAQVYVNNNGNITFGSSNSTFTPTPISSIRSVLIAPFWADVDTTGTGSGLTSYGQDMVDGHKAFGANWVDVGYYDSKVDKVNSFQVVLIDRSDLGVGFFDIELNYASVQWETGDASGGSNGLGGNPARAGFSNGSGTAGTYFELPGSGVAGALLSGGANSLASNSTNSGGVAGRYVYNVRAGSIVCGTGISTTSATVPINGGPVSVAVTASNPACTWSVTSLPSWITVNSPAGGNGTGSATVSLQVAANSGSARSVVITIAGQSFTVNQSGSAVTPTCPPYSFQRAADVSMMSGSTSQGSLGGLERLLDGSMTLHNFTGSISSYLQSSTPQYQQAFTSCIGLPPSNPSPPQNYSLLSEQRGTSSINPVVTNLMNNGQSSSVGVGQYSLDSAKLQVWNATANKTPGPRANYDAPANPAKLLSADMNSDGKRDVILLSQGAPGGQGVASIYPGNGDGTLGARRDKNVGVNPQSSTVFDFNGDNRLDVAVANTGSNNVMILNGNGDNTLQDPVTLTGDAPGPRAISAADLNKDGKGDLVIGHADGVDIRLGNGNGSFQAPVRVARGFVANSVATGDFNRDGNLDIAVSTDSSASTLILLGNGNGTFGSPSSYVTRANAGPFFATDFNSDGNTDIVFAAGHPDAIVAANGDSKVTVLYSRSNGTFNAPSNTVLPSLGDFTVGDFNSDGFPDVVSTAPSTGGQANTAGMNLALNNGNGGLVTQTPIPVPSTGAAVQLSRITSADFNLDGKRDVAVTGGSTVYIQAGNGAGGFSTIGSFPATSQMTFITAADVNLDGRPDLIITDEGEDKVSVSLGNGNGTFQQRTSYNVSVDPKAAAVTDVNGDGKPDLIVANLGQPGGQIQGGVSVLLANGSFQPASNFGSGSNPNSVSVGDVNADGKPDIVTSTSGANNATLVGVHLGNGNGTFQAVTLIPVAFGPAQTALTDFNGDGKVDIVVGHCCGDVQMGVLVGNGNGTFQSETFVPNTGNGSSFVVAADMNKDLKPDIVFGAGGANGAFVAMILNAAAAAPTCTFAASQTAYSAAAAGQTLYGTLSASAGTCAFTGQPSASWLTLTPTAGTGTTSYAIIAAPNTGVARTGTVTIGGQTITISQAAPACPFSLAPFTLSPPPAGGVYQVALTSSPGCAWSISGVPSWATIVSPASLNGSGSGTIMISVAANPGVARIANLTIAGRAFAITQAGIGPAGGLRFTAVPPCRLLETRAEYNFEGRTGAFGPPALAGGETRTLSLPNSTVCRTIPANAKGYVLNVTLVPNGPLDFLTVYPTGETRPDFWTVRSPDGLIVANSAVVAAGTGGGINVYSSNSTNAIIDISGYFTDDPVVSNLVYYPLTPCRVIETRAEYRTPPGPFGPPTMARGETRNFRFPGNPYCPVPVGAAAYAATITVVPPGPLAFLTAWPEGGSQPNVSSMNSPAGRVLANSVIVPASADGGISLFTYDRSDVIVDITGYFGPDDGATGMFFFPVRQCRISQTNGTGFTGIYNGPMFADESTRTIPVPSSACAGISPNARAYSLNATVMPGGSPMPFLTIYPSGQGRPNASVINAFEGQTVSSGFLVSAGVNGAVDIFAYRHTHVALEISGYFGR